tara:strand:+ start:379 stop:762 length:384 start_codon:yes stop_codon:yes gene_type:complete
MSLIEVSFIIESDSPGDLASFYEKVSEAKASQGLSSEHYVINKSHEFKIQIYRSSKKRISPIKGFASAVCFQKKTNLDPISEVKRWSENLISIGARTIDAPRLEPFGAELWMIDPEGNAFLLMMTSL